MSAVPIPIAPMEDGGAVTPVQSRRLPLPKSEGKERYFGTPLSGNSAVLVDKSVTTSKKARVRPSSSKKIVRAKKIVQQHRSPPPPVSSMLPVSSSMTTSPLAGNNNNNAAEYESFTYTVTFLPGPMGFQPEPAHGPLGCRIYKFADDDVDGKPGQARLSNQVQLGDFIVEINDEVVSHLHYSDIVNQLKAKADMPRKILFRRLCRRKSTPAPKGANNHQQQQQLVETPRTAPRPSTTQLQFNAQGKLTPMVVVSPPMQDSTEEARKSVSSILFMDPQQVAAASKTSPYAFARTGSFSYESPSPTSAYSVSPAYNLLPNHNQSTATATPSSSSNGNVVLDINDSNETETSHSHSIDTTSTISPSKVKNMSQEDLEMGLGQIITTGIKSKATVWRNVFSSVSRLGEALNNNGNNNRGPTSNSAPNVVEDSALEEKKEDEGVQKKSDLTEHTNAVMQNQESERVWILEQRLTEANDMVQSLTSALTAKQREMDRRLQDAHDERVRQLPQVPVATQTEQQEVGSDSANELQTLQLELSEATAKLQNLTKERDEALGSLQTANETMQSMRATEKSAQLASQLQVAKLQREARLSKKEIEALLYNITEEGRLKKEAESRRETAETELQEKEEELQGIKCMIDAYEEKFMEQEMELEVVMEEKDFGARELDFARSEVRRLTQALKKRDEELLSGQQELDDQKTNSANEIQRLQENVNMANKELADQRQKAFDRERELQDQLTSRNSKIQCLEETLVQRDADLNALKDEIGTNVVALKDKLVAKENSLQVTQTELSELQIAHAELRLEHQEQVSVQSELQASLSKRSGELANASTELDSAKKIAAFLQQEKEVLEGEATRLKETANSMYQEKCRITKDLQTAKVELSDTKIQATKTQDSLLQRAKNLDNKVKEAQTELKKTQNEQATLTDRLERANAKIESLSDDVEQKESALQAANGQLKALEEERDELWRHETQRKVELEEKETERQTLQESCRDVTSKLFEASSRISFFERQISEYESAKKLSDKEAGVLHEEIASLQSKLESQREELDNRSSELSAKSVHVMNLETKTENLSEELQQLSEEVEAAQRSLVTAQAQYSQLNERFSHASDEASGKIQSLTSELIKAQDEVDDNIKARSKLEKQIQWLRQQGQSSSDEVSSLRAQLRAQEEKVQELTNLSETAKKETQSTMAVLEEKVDRLSILNKKLEKECDARVEDNKQLHLNISGLEKKLANARSLFGTEQAKHKNCRAEMEDIILSQKQELATLKEQLHTTSSELDNKRKELQDSQVSFEDQLAIVRNDVATKEAKLADLLQEREENTKTISNCEDELSMANLEIQRVDESRKRSREEVARLNQLVDSLREDSAAQFEAVSKAHGIELKKCSKEKELLEAAIEKSTEANKKLQSRIVSLQKLVEEERENNEALQVEQDALATSLHRAEDLAADLKCQLNILNEEKANESVDSIDSQTMALSKSELRTKCKHLSEEVQESEIRAASAGSAVSQKQMHIRRLEEDLAEMGAELGRMVESSEQLESALLKARMEKANCESDAEALRTSIDVHQAKTSALKEELDQQYNENSELLDQVRSLQTKQKESGEREDLWQEDLEKAKQVMMLLDEEKIAAQKEMAQMSEELEAMCEKREAADTKIAGLASKISNLEEKLTTTEKERDLLQKESQAIRLGLEEQVRELRNECAALASSQSSMESESEAHLATIRNLEKSKLDLQEKLAKERNHGLKMENLREEAVTELTEASRVVAAQKGIIKVQEARAAEAEERAKGLHDEIASLQASISKMEYTTEETGAVRSSQLEELERKRTHLEKARLNAKAEADALRDEVRKANRKASELDRINKSLQARIDDLKTTADSTKTQLREVRGAWEASENVAKKLENDVQGARAEIDHLRMKLQLGGATIARLKSDRVLIQEAAMQASLENNSSDPTAVARELSKLKSELHTKASQLSSASTSLRNYKKMCSDMKTTEKQLVIFIDDIISQADATFVALANLAEGLRKSVPLEVATSGTPEKVIDDANCCLNRFVSLVQEASADLESKRRKLDTWKTQSKIHTTTPQNNKSGGASSDSLLTPNQSSALRAFRRMREVVISATSQTSEIDYPQVESVIMALEGQIDALCSELTAANNALCEKDKLFASLEQERNMIQTKLESSGAVTTSEKDSSKLSAIQEVSEDEKEKLQIAGARMIAKVLESRAKSDAAGALRKWSNSTAAMHAAGQQRHAAEALSKQLEMTRGKLAQLKTQFKKSKTNGSSSESPNR